MFKTELGTFINDDSANLIGQIERPKLVLTDPPYLIGYTLWRKKGMAVVGDISGNRKVIDIVLGYAEMLPDDGALYCFCSWKTVEVWKTEIEKVIPVKNIIIWVKNNWTAGDLIAQYGQSYEMIIYAPKKKHMLKGTRIMDVWFYDRVKTHERIHPTQKPESVIERIILKSTEPGDLVLDPFAGSGTVAVVAERLNRRWICIEINPEVYKRAIERLQNSMKNLCFNF